MCRIYLSYRRMDATGYAGRLFDHLNRHFGVGSVFMDIGGISGGEEFSRVIDSALNSCDVVLVLIGRSWATCAGSDGRRRLDDPKDWVRLEVAAALRRDILVVPVLVEGARVPDPISLPEELQALCGRHARELSDLRWSFDVGELIKDVERAVRPRKRLQILPVKDKRLRWLTGSAIILALLLGVAFVVSTAFKKTLQVQNDTARRLVPPSSAALEVIPRASEKNTPDNKLSAAIGFGILDFNWPGDDSWDIYRGEQLIASHYGHATQALQADTYIIKPKSNPVFNPFDVSIKSGSATKTELGGVLDFNWPGDDSWDICRGEQLVASHYGHATQALQAGTYTIKPKSNPVFMPINIEIKDGRKTIFP